MKDNAKFGQEPQQIQSQVEAAVRNGDDIVLIHRDKATSEPRFWSTASQQKTEDLLRSAVPELAE